VAEQNDDTGDRAIPTLSNEVERFSRELRMESANIPTVFVIDDDADIRASIRGLLKSAGLRSEGFERAEQFLQTELSDSPSCLVLDVSLPGINGLEFQQQLTKAGRQIPIIFVTGHGDIPMSVKAMKSGAVEFLTKPLKRNVLLDAIHQALARDSIRRQEQADIALLKARYDTLSRRQHQVMALVVSGQLNKQIASELGTTLVTVKLHRAQMMRKMQARSLAELVRMAEKLRLFPST